MSWKKIFLISFIPVVSVFFFMVASIFSITNIIEKTNCNSYQLIFGTPIAIIFFLIGMIFAKKTITLIEEEEENKLVLKFKREEKEPDEYGYKVSFFSMFSIYFIFLAIILIWKIIT